MSYTSYESAVPFNILSNYGAIDVLAKQKPLAPFMDSPFKSVIDRNNTNLSKDNLYDVDYGNQKMKNENVLQTARPLNLKAYMKKPTPFDGSPFMKQIKGNQNYHSITETRLGMDQYLELLNSEMEAENAAVAKEQIQAQLLLPGILKKITDVDRQIKAGIIPGTAKPNFSPMEIAYMNLLGNLSPAELFAKYQAVSSTGEPLQPGADAIIGDDNNDGIPDEEEVARPGAPEPEPAPERPDELDIEEEIHDTIEESSDSHKIAFLEWYAGLAESANIGEDITVLPSSNPIFELLQQLKDVVLESQLQIIIDEIENILFEEEPRPDGPPEPIDAPERPDVSDDDSILETFDFAYISKLRGSHDDRIKRLKSDMIFEQQSYYGKGDVLTIINDDTGRQITSNKTIYKKLRDGKKLVFDENDVVWYLE